MLRTLGRVAQEARLEAGLTQARIAAAAGVTDPVISFLERGIRYPRALDAVVSAYETECGLSEGELWKRASALLG